MDLDDPSAEHIHAGPATAVVLITGGHAVVLLAGDLDRTSAAHLRPRLLRLAAGGSTGVIVDLTAVDRIDDAGRALLGALERRCDLEGTELVLRRPTARPTAVG
jgi:anti-anti-sigma factor